eukprot:gnl/TRDRNA2_/TRDRNA2_170808_c0_seq4.p1 gnl/TRDRNA2_/TRDRNA2_170808_c0~~gnl/TRDRNA2_/TRDRNA2_170808_c0_seq4.p1  ORF type:complete len:100 (-),score=9.99 gnl/TRDRNA2_/TRDRNA2_170808_c0_seq4:177-476(-)
MVSMDETEATRGDVYTTARASETLKHVAKKAFRTRPSTAMVGGTSGVSAIAVGRPGVARKMSTGQRRKMFKSEQSEMKPFVISTSTPCTRSSACDKASS